MTTMNTVSCLYALLWFAVMRYGAAWVPWRLPTKSFRLQAEKPIDVLNQIDDWSCIKRCGACCKLGPVESREGLEEYLTPEEYKQYTAMIGEDNWCKFFDKSSRLCTIYESRPQFCRVGKVETVRRFSLDTEDFADFCTFCCKEQISDVYGPKSDEMARYTSTINRLVELNEEKDEEIIIIDPREGMPADLVEDDEHEKEHE